MVGYAVKSDGSWRCIDTDTMELKNDETLQLEQPTVTILEE